MSQPYDDETELTALGAVVEQGRGSLPFALIHGEALVACAAWALGEARVTPVDLRTGWGEVVESGGPFVLHDPLCPMTPPSFIVDCLTRAVERDVVVVGVAGVLSGGEVRQVVASPVVLPASVVAALDERGSTDLDQPDLDQPDLDQPDLDQLVTDLREQFVVEVVLAPPSARRVSSLDDVRDLEASTVTGAEHEGAG